MPGSSPSARNANPPSDALKQLAGRELKISIRPHGQRYWEFEGTRAQLEDEGVIPADIEWPEDASGYRWVSGRLEFFLHRTIPGDFKGPLKPRTSSGDWWFLCCGFKDSWSEAVHAIRQRDRDRYEEAYSQTSAGRREALANWKRYRSAKEDKAFQAFKTTLLPQRKKPDRRPKTSP